MGPWINMTPPIRGGPYQQPQHRQPAVILPTSDLGGSSLHDKSSSLHHRATGASSKSGGVAPPRSSTSDSAAPAAHPESREDFIQWAIDQDIEKCLRDYPSLELDVQQDIAFKYRQLHQRVIDEGLYQCRYSQYGKELCRYTALFAGFLAFLHYGWYTTSAVFLGVFWVRRLLPLRLIWQSHLVLTDVLSIASNHVQRPRCWTSRHHWQLCHRLGHWYLHRRLLLWPVHWMVEEQPQRSSPRHQPASRFHVHGSLGVIIS